MFTLFAAASHGTGRTIEGKRGTLLMCREKRRDSRMKGTGTPCSFVCMILHRCTSSMPTTATTSRNRSARCADTSRLKLFDESEERRCMLCVPGPAPAFCTAAGLFCSSGMPSMQRHTPERRIGSTSGAPDASKYAAGRAVM